MFCSFNVRQTSFPHFFLHNPLYIARCLALCLISLCIKMTHIVQHLHMLIYMQWFKHHWKHFRGKRVRLTIMEKFVTTKPAWLLCFIDDHWKLIALVSVGQWIRLGFSSEFTGISKMISPAPQKRFIILISPVGVQTKTQGRFNGPLTSE